MTRFIDKMQHEEEYKWHTPRARQARTRSIRVSGNLASWRSPRTEEDPARHVGGFQLRTIGRGFSYIQQIWLSAQPRRTTGPQTTTTKSQHRLTFECFWMLLRKEPNTETQLSERYLVIVALTDTHTWPWHCHSREITEVTKNDLKNAWMPGLWELWWQKY